jgi:hypothetical protein
VEYPLSRRAGEALLNLAQLEYARRDLTAAQRHLDRLLREHPTGPLVAKASYWNGRFLLDAGDVTRGCGSIATARAAVASEDVELRNQIDYFASRCADAARADSGARADSIARVHADSVAAASRPDASRGPATERQAFSVQVAAFARRSDAAALVAQLKRRGYDARVAGTSAPYRVRVGRYASRDRAAQALSRLKRGNPRAIIVEAEPR